MISFHFSRESVILVFMFRSLFFIIKLCVFSALVVWAASHPGSVRIEWLNYAVTVHTGLAFAVLMGAVAVAVFLHQIYRSVVNFPAQLRRYHVFQEQKKGLAALTSGLAAVAAGDARQVLLHAGRARHYLPDDAGLSLLLQAQAARMKGDDGDALRHFKALMADKRAGFLGLRGLLQKALDEGNIQQASLLVQAGLKRYKRNPWLSDVGYRIALQDENWSLAIDLLDGLVAMDALKKGDERSDRLALLVAQADCCLQEDPKKALRFLKKALAIDPDFVPVLKRLVALYVQGGQRKKAQSLVEKAWRRGADFSLAQLWMVVIAKNKSSKVMERIQWAEKLVAWQPRAADGHLIVGSIMLEEGLWGEARDHFLKARDLYQGDDHAVSPRVYHMLATLERRQSQDETAAQEWLLLARQAQPDKAWVCQQTGQIYDEWSYVALSHGGFNSMVWERPLSVVAQPPVLRGLDPMVGLLSAA